MANIERMLTLYVKTGCAYCAAVLHALEELALPFEEKNVSDEAISAELIAKGGKLQMPYLIDSEHNVALYESEDIIEHLMKMYGGDARKDGKEPDAPAVCLPE